MRDTLNFDAMRLLNNGYKLTGDLPISIVEKMSDIEIIYHLCGMVQECQNKVEGLATDNNNYTDKQIALVKESLTEEVEKLNTLVGEMGNNAKSYTDEEVAEVTKKIENIVTSINKQIDTILTDNSKLDNKVTELQKQIKSANMNVTCPTCGVDMTIQEALYHIYNSIRVTISWLDFDNKINSYTWESFATKMNGVTWTKFEYDLNSVLALNVETINLENN